MSWARSPRTEAGTTLIELLVAVAIMGIAFVTILGGIGMAILGSEYQRKQVTVAAVVTNAAEAVKAMPYVDCASSYEVPAAIVPEGFSVSPPGAAVLGYWRQDFGGDRFDPTPCSAADSGLQLIQLSVTSNNRPVTESVQVVKRRP